LNNYEHLQLNTWAESVDVMRIFLISCQYVLLNCTAYCMKTAFKGCDCIRTALEFLDFYYIL